MLNSEEMKPIAIAIFYACMKALVGQSISQSAENSVKYEIFEFHITIVVGCRVSLKIFNFLANC